ncbi:hypothetical protein [Entomoplasma freundtii]|uniref:hypothetical protein n=1 Tax=Entomoplasma freundtii TaxID=74700 RepID=UPI0014170E12|nr:hypothetical protein [Entomoplasma freundtii]
MGHWVVLANASQEIFFKRGGDNLFIFENNKLSFNISQEWTIAGQECNSKNSEIEN